MRHPPVEELLGGGDAAREHLDACPACRRVAALADDPEAPRPPAAADDDFPADAIDRARYSGWSALGVGGGGMGRIFRAFDVRLGREVVIKQPRGRELRARFEREALLTARLQHPAIVGVYEAGRFGDGEPFYAMPRVRGAPLSDEIARRTSADERLALLPHVTAVCEAVAYAHEQGIVHRDLKPANVLVGAFGETVVIDWGLATDLHAREAEGAQAALEEVGDGLTQLGVGTPNYMPPEQAGGAAADPRMDVYALGATLYHTLAGAPPYGEVDTVQVRPRLLAGPPAPLAAIAPSVAPALRDIVARAMARAPADRFASARELAEELRRFQTGRLVQSRRYTPAEILRHFARRYRAPLAVAAIAGALLAGVAVVSAVRVTRAGNAAQAAQRRAEANERASRIELQRGMGVAASRLALLPTRRADALALAVGAVAPALEAGDAPVPEARQGLHDAIGRAPAIVLEGHAAPLGAFVFSPDGARLAGRAPGDHSVHLWDGRTGRHLATVAAGGAHFAIDAFAFSPDGTRLLTWARAPAQAQLWPVEADAPPITLDHDGALAGATFFADGTILLAGVGLTYVDGHTGAAIQRKELRAPATALASAGDRAVVVRPGMVELWNAKGEFVAKIPTGVVRAAALAPDGARLALLDATGVDLHDLGVARPRRVPLVAPPSARLAFTASGGLLVVRDDGAPALVIDGGSDAPPAELELGAAAIDGDRVVSARPGRLALIDPASLAPARVIEGPPGLAVAAIAIGPGERVAVATESEAWLVDARAAEAGVLVGHTSEVSGLAAVGAHLVSVGLDGRAFAWSGDGARAGAARLDREAVAFAAAGGRVAVGGLDGVVAVHDVAATGELGRGAPLTAPGLPIAALAIAEDGGWIAAARTDGELLLIDASARTAPARVRDPAAPPIAALAFAPAAPTLAAIDVTGKVELWDAPRAARVAARQLPAVDDIDRALYTAAFAGGERLLAARFGGDTLALRLPALTDDGALAGRVVAVGAGGARVVTVGAGGEVDVHDAGRAPRRVLASPRPVTAVALSPDARVLAVGDADGVARVVSLRELRDLGDGRDAAPLELVGGGGAVSALAFTTDGQHLAVGHASGALQLHPLRPAAALARACRTLALLGRAEPGCVSAPGAPGAR